MSDMDIYDRSIVVRRKVDIKNLKDTRFDLDVVKRDEALNIEVLTAPEGVDILDFIEEMRASGNFEFVEPNVRVGINPPAPPEDQDLKTEGEALKNKLPSDPTIKDQ